MKKRAIGKLCLSILLAALLLCGCGTKSAGGSASADECGAQTSGSLDSMDGFAPESAPAEAPQKADTSSASEESAADNAYKDAKLIYRGSLTMETISFDKTIKAVEDLVAQCGGYLESSGISDPGSAYRSASYTARIPVEKYEGFFSSAGSLCHVLDQYKTTENVTQYYYDTAGRLETQETKLKRLQELLSQAESMEDIITIESAISDTEYQIESLTGELRHYDDLVDFATVDMTINEVYKLSNVEEPADSFGGLITKAAANGWGAFVDGIEQLVVAIAYNLAWVVILVVLAVIITIYIRRRIKRRRTRLKEVSVSAPAGEEQDRGKK